MVWMVPVDDEIPSLETPSDYEKSDDGSVENLLVASESSLAEKEKEKIGDQSEYPDLCFSDSDSCLGSDNSSDLPVVVSRGLEGGSSLAPSHVDVITDDIELPVLVLSSSDDESECIEVMTVGSDLPPLVCSDVEDDGEEPRTFKSLVTAEAELCDDDEVSVSLPPLCVSSTSSSSSVAAVDVPSPEEVDQTVSSGAILPGKVNDDSVAQTNVQPSANSVHQRLEQMERYAIPGISPSDAIREAAYWKAKADEITKQNVHLTSQLRETEQKNLDLVEDVMDRRLEYMNELSFARHRIEELEVIEKRVEEQRLSDLSDPLGVKDYYADSEAIRQWVETEIGLMTSTHLHQVSFAADDIIRLVMRDLDGMVRFGLTTHPDVALNTIRGLVVEKALSSVLMELVDVKALESAARKKAVELESQVSDFKVLKLTEAEINDMSLQDLLEAQRRLKMIDNNVTDHQLLISKLLKQKQGGGPRAPPPLGFTTTKPLQTTTSPPTNTTQNVPNVPIQVPQPTETHPTALPAPILRRPDPLQMSQMGQIDTISGTQMGNGSQRGLDNNSFESQYYQTIQNHPLPNNTAQMSQNVPNVPNSGNSTTNFRSDNPNWNTDVRNMANRYEEDRYRDYDGNPGFSGGRGVGNGNSGMTFANYVPPPPPGLKTMSQNGMVNNMSQMVQNNPNNGYRGSYMPPPHPHPPINPPPGRLTVRPQSIVPPNPNANANHHPSDQRPQQQPPKMSQMSQNNGLGGSSTGGSTNKDESAEALRLFNEMMAKQDANLENLKTKDMSIDQSVIAERIRDRDNEVRRRMMEHAGTKSMGAGKRRRR